MGIVYRTGDILEAFRKGEIDVLIHQTNCQGVMGSGVAKQIKQQFPYAFEVYKNRARYGLKLGEISFAQFLIEDASKHGWIVNLNGQDQYIDRTKCNTNYAALGKGLMEVNQEFPNLILAMPKIGAGLGGGNWEIISAIIESAFPNKDVYVYTLEDKPKSSGKNDNA